jgi:hypothetical protein
MPGVTERPVIILGAGATKACGGPLTDEILPAALNGEMTGDAQENEVQDREQLLGLSRQFLAECFHVPINKTKIEKRDCPSLPMVLSMLRRSLDLNKPLGQWQGDRLVKARRAVEYSVFAVIEAALRDIPAGQDSHSKMLEPIYQRGIAPSVVSLNYDVIIDNVMFRMSEQYGGMRPPDYSVRIDTEQYLNFSQAGTFGRLLKIHGSLNWLYCEVCGRLDLFVSKGMRTAKALDELYNTVPFDDAYSCRGTPCRNPNCDGFISPILITPTYVKDYENKHIEKTWAAAEEAMKESDRVVIIGYSLPTDDVEVAMLLQRGLNHLTADRITVVEYVDGDGRKPPNARTPIDGHPTGQRFSSLFGPGLDWHTTGFQGWLSEQRVVNRFPFSPA